MSSYNTLLLLCLGLVNVVSAQTSTCIPDTQNSCKVNCSGTILDISKIVTYPYTISGDAGNKFTYDPCNGVDCNGVTSAVCQAKDSVKVNCGTIASADWQLISSTSPYQFQIQYSGDIGADSCSSNFQFQQTNDKEISITFAKGDSEFFEFDVKGKCIGQQTCEEPTNHHEDAADITGIVGLVLIFLFLAAVITYFIVGVIVMKFYKGATGKELIPNYGFWSDLPFLIKDGFLFVISPCRRLRSKGQYESI